MPPHLSKKGVSRSLGGGLVTELHLLRGVGALEMGDIPWGGLALCPPRSEHTVLSPTEPCHQPASFESQTSPAWEASLGRLDTPDPVLGKAVVKGLRDSQRLQWEVSFELEPPGHEPGSPGDADLWRETFHHLAARAIIRDFEQLAERESEIEQGELSAAS